MVLRWGAVTSPGLIRANNEDAYFVNEEIGLFAVADGMGGHQAGEVASKLALQVLNRELMNISIHDVSGETLVAAVQEANKEVFSKSQTKESYSGMGTTLTACLVRGYNLILGHVGDSRLYLMRAGVLSQITEDHSAVQELLNQGSIKAEEADAHPYRNMLIRALGTEPALNVDLHQYKLLAGDRLLLCTDGLTRLVPEKFIQTIITEDKDPGLKVQDMLKKALQQGGKDNITIILVVL